jgi:hypothetical protein
MNWGALKIEFHKTIKFSNFNNHKKAIYEKNFSYY